jgi:hypothetical protein
VIHRQDSFDDQDLADAMSDLSQEIVDDNEIT